MHMSPKDKKLKIAGLVRVSFRHHIDETKGLNDFEKQIDCPTLCKCHTKQNLENM